MSSAEYRCVRRIGSPANIVRRLAAEHLTGVAAREGKKFGLVLLYRFDKPFDIQIAS